MRIKKRTMATLALTAVACSDSPTAPRREITLHLCGAAWAAYRNDGDAWQSLPSGLSTREATFAATDRLAIATVSGVTGQFFAPFLQVHYLTAEQAEARFVCAGALSVAPPPNTKQLRGSVAGMNVEATVYISMGRGVASAETSFPNFQVSAPSDGPADLIATQFLSSPAPISGRADKIILRRSESHADGATMPVLDFASSEPFAPQPNTLTIDGFFTGTVSVSTNVVTQRGAFGALKYDFDQSSAVVTTHSLPASRLVEGDLHVTSVVAGDRSILFFYRTPADRTIALGPPARTPVLTVPAGSSNEVVRIDVPSQPEYDSQITAVLAQPQPSTSNNTVRISATREYFGGTPATWSLVVPNLTGVSGFSPSWGLSPGGNGARVTVTGIPHGHSSGSARDGDIYRSATAFRTILIPSPNARPASP